MCPVDIAAVLQTSALRSFDSGLAPPPPSFIYGTYIDLRFSTKEEEEEETPIFAVEGYLRLARN